MKQPAIMILLTASIGLFGQSKPDLLRKLTANKGNTLVAHVDDTDFEPTIAVFPEDRPEHKAKKLAFKAKGNIISPGTGGPAHWTLRDDSIEIDRETFTFNPKTKSFFSPATPGASFGKHLIPFSIIHNWCRKRREQVIAPNTYREILHFWIKRGEGGHDTIVDLIRVGDKSSIPYLIVFLDRNHPCSSTGYICSVEHAVEALMKITGFDFGFCAKDWAIGLNLSLEECKTLVPEDAS